MSQKHEYSRTVFGSAVHRMQQNDAHHTQTHALLLILLLVVGCSVQQLRVTERDSEFLSCAHTRSSHRMYSFSVLLLLLSPAVT